MKKITRKEKRSRESEKNFFVEFIKIKEHFFKDLIKKLKKVKDCRNQSYINYGVEVLLLMMILKNALGIKSMRDMTVKFNKRECIENMAKVLEVEKLEELPHYDTINDFLCKLENKEIEKIRDYMVKELLKKRCLEQHKYQGKYWIIAIDATGLFYFRERHCEHCLKKEFKNKETGEVERTAYYHNVLEAKLIIGDMVFSIATEFIENEEENVTKQDCERNAFKRLEKKLKSKFPRLPIVVLGDSLYACEPVFKICEKNKWEFIFRFKEGSIKTVAAEFNKLKEYDKNEHANCIWVNEIAYNKRTVNVVEMKAVEKEKEKYFLFITSLHITKNKVAAIVLAGRSRWKIENEGFNTQKNIRYDIEHANSLDYNAMKNHYLLIQITDIIRQLFELGAIKMRGLIKSIKEISSNLLESFRTRLLTAEDISKIRKRTQIRLQ